MLDKVFREPLVHFLGGALLVFAFFWATGNDRDSADYAIGIDESDLARLEANWIQNFRRAPTQAELDSLIDQEIAEEMRHHRMPSCNSGWTKIPENMRYRHYTISNKSISVGSAQQKPASGSIS